MPFAPYLAAAKTAWAAADDGLSEQRQKWSDQVEESTAACMARAGFDYKPRPYQEPEDRTEEDSPYVDQDTLTIPWLPRSLEEVQRVGYGVEKPEEPPQDLPFPEDPNTAYLDSLSESAREQYESSLIGKDPVTGQVPNPNACLARAQSEHPEPTGPDMSFLDPADRMNSIFDLDIDMDRGMPVTLPDTVDSDPEVVALRDEFANCALATEFAPRLGGAPWVEPQWFVALARKTAADGTVRDLPPGPFDPATVPQDQLWLVGSQPERDVAVADFKCREQTDYVNRYAQRVAAMETKWVADHQAELDQMMAQIETFMDGRD
jgi:hypothetical protein